MTEQRDGSSSADNPAATPNGEPANGSDGRVGTRDSVPKKPRRGRPPTPGGYKRVFTEEQRERRRQRERARWARMSAAWCEVTTGGHRAPQIYQDLGSPGCAGARRARAKRACDRPAATDVLAVTSPSTYRHPGHGDHPEDPWRGRPPTARSLPSRARTSAALNLGSQRKRRSCSWIR